MNTCVNAQWIFVLEFCLSFHQVFPREKSIDLSHQYSVHTIHSSFYGYCFCIFSLLDAAVLCVRVRANARDAQSFIGLIRKFTCRRARGVRIHPLRGSVTSLTSMFPSGSEVFERLRIAGRIVFAIALSRAG